MKKITLLSLALLLFSCIKEKNEPIPHEFTAGIMVLNEGNYMSSNASMTGYDPETRKSTPDLFSIMAGGNETMGDSPVCIYNHEGTCFMTISGSGKIYAFDPDESKLLYTITGVSSPRFIYGYGDFIWVSDLYKTTLTKINIKSRSIVEEVEIGGSAEMLVPYGGFLYANMWNMGKSIVKLNPSTGSVLETLEVGIQPYAMAVDSKNGILWAYCDGGGWDGNPVGFEDPSLYKINIKETPMKVEQKYELESIKGFTYKLTMGQDGYLYLINGDVYKMDKNATKIPTTPFIESNGKSFYAIATTKEGDIYLTDTGDYISDGTCYRYNSSGVQIDSFKTGICPGFIYVHTGIK